MTLVLEGWKDRAEDVTRVEDTFNKYINPGEDAIWNEAAAAASHQLSPTDPRILAADGIDVVWGQFERWIAENSHIFHATARSAIFVSMDILLVSSTEVRNRR